MKTAQSIFNRIRMQKITSVHQVKTCPLTDLSNLKLKLKEVDDNSVIWQHNRQYHMVAMYIKKGTGYSYNRDIYDLYYSGVNTLAKFRKQWEKTNHNLRLEYDGKIPKTTKSKSSNDRRKQKSYIVAEQTAQTLVDRTHLIPVSVTGIEYHRGLLIDYDREANRGGMNDFERQVLKINTEKDIIWTTSVFPSKKKKGLVLRYIIFNHDWKIIKKKDFIDTKNIYNWYVD
ncbi:hypothetical protein ACWCL1_08040 [Ligilactobacillus sp. LYQ135]